MLGLCGTQYSIQGMIILYEGLSVLGSVHGMNGSYTDANYSSKCYNYLE